MNRMVAVLGGDIRLQFRNGFYYAATFVAVLSIAVLQLLDRELLARLLPALVFSNLLMNTFYFIGGLVLLEKAEGTLVAQVVTPLETGEYLASKVVTLTGLAVLENTAIVSLVYGTDLRFVPLLSGMVAASAIYALFGFEVVSRYDSINEYLFPSFVYTLLFAPPLFPYFGIGDGWWVYLHPMQAPLVLLEGAFSQIAPWEWIYAVLYSAAWIVVAFLLSRRAFHRFVIAAEGVR